MYDKENANDTLMLVRLVEECRTPAGYVNWQEAVVKLNKYFHEERTREGWRGQYRLLVNEDFKKQRERAITRRDDKRVNRFELKDRLLKHLSRERSMPWLLEKIGASEVDILAAVQELQMKGYNLSAHERDGEKYFKLEKRAPNHKNIYDHKTADREIKIALISDTHMVRKYQQFQSFHHFYEYAHSQGVTKFYHAGDMTDGYYPHRPGNVYEVHRHGFQQQMEYKAETYPQIDGCTTYFITGRN